MIIGVDGNEANVEHKVGVSVYTINLLTYFRSQASKDVRFIIYLRKHPQSDLPSSNEYFTYTVVWGPFLWSQVFLPVYLWIYKLLGGKLHVFFSPAHYIPRCCPFPTVVSVHDLSYLYFPNEFLKKDLYQLKNWTEYALSKSVQIIAVSKTTKKDIMHEYTIPDNKIEVVYNGYENEIHPLPIPSPHTPHPTPYFLFIGTIQPRKNLEFLIAAFSFFKKTHPKFKLILAGKKGWLYDNIFSQVTHLGMQDSIIFLGYITEEEKDNLYKNASAFILPSLYEGFGIPLLEAMAHNCPVLSSFNSSLPEVGGEACLYFDPKSRDDLVEKMNIITSDGALVRKLIAAGKKRIEIFSWEESGKNTLRILQSIPE